MRISLIATLGAGLSSLLPATPLYLGTLGILPDLGSPGWQQVLLYNKTGIPLDCSTAASVYGGNYSFACGPVNITQWTVEVSYLDNTGTLPPSPGLNSGSTIASDNDPIVDPLFALPYTITNACPPCDSIVTQVVFTFILPTSFSIYDSVAATPSTFYPQGRYTFTYVPSAAYLNGTQPGDGTDLIIDQDSGGGGAEIPEPATFALVLAGAAIVARRHFAR